METMTDRPPPKDGHESDLQVWDNFIKLAKDEQPLPSDVWQWAVLSMLRRIIDDLECDNDDRVARTRL